MAHVVFILLRGFKSVGFEWLEVRVKRRLNAVVGSNGCGKSSLLEALCFAFAVPPAR
jgi:chromosome segregation ATPase